jgi:hypothetical protein
MSDLYDIALKCASQLLRLKPERRGEALTEDEVSDAASKGIAAAKILLDTPDDVDRERLVRHLLAIFETRIGTAHIISSIDQHEEWYDSARAARKWPFWGRYREYLLEDKNWPTAVVNGLDASTDDILRLLENPSREGAWDRRGLVVGHVQSGKTANYVGLLNKAVDAGYGLFIVLAGMHNSLRSQTQVRVEEGFSGIDTSASHKKGSRTVVAPVGVGCRLIRKTFAINSITSRDDNGDFSKAAAKTTHIQPGQDPLIMVIKKNGSVLKNVIEWIRSFAHHTDSEGDKFVAGVPILLIDDEADQATIDTARVKKSADPDDYDPTVINGRIREILRLFEKSAYVGFTATPFANILIHDAAETESHGQDLFPRSFIISLPAPSDYVGPARIFGLSDQAEQFDGLPLIRRISDYAVAQDTDDLVGWMPPKHKKDHVPRVCGRRDIPLSLHEALRAFVLACAARRARGQRGEHNSMLVHVTRFIDVQHEVYDQVGAAIEDTRQGLRYDGGNPASPARKALSDLWHADFDHTSREISIGPHADLSGGCAPLQWREVEAHIAASVEAITIHEINGKSADILEYTNTGGEGKTIIAIGGDKLSRGLTLEGLTVSYFLRASKMYDTLMQMGRWFGYRQGYVDLCRLYTTGELVEWYGHIARASEELREDFARMSREKRTPAEFGHRVRSHPTLLVTSPIKMRHGKKMRVDFSGDRVETLNFFRNKRRCDDNFAAAEKLVRAVGDIRGPGRRLEKGHTIWSQVPASPVIRFLDDYVLHPSSMRVNLDLVRAYLEKEIEAGRATDWSLVLGAGKGVLASIGGLEVNTVIRKWWLKGTEDEKVAEKADLMRLDRLRVQGVNDPATEALHLTESQRQEAVRIESEHRRMEKMNIPDGDPTRPSSAALRQVLRETQCLLTIYPIQSCDRGENGPEYRDFVEPAAQGSPVIGFVISLPNVLGGGSQVDYVVNTVYQGELEFEDE